MEEQAVDCYPDRISHQGGGGEEDVRVVCHKICYLTKYLPLERTVERGLRLIKKCSLRAAIQALLERSWVGFECRNDPRVSTQNFVSANVRTREKPWGDTALGNP